MRDRTLWMTIGTIALVLIVTSADWIGLAALFNGSLQPHKGPDGQEVTGLGRQFFFMLFEPTPVWDLFRSGLATLVALVGVGSIASDKINVRGGAVMIALVVSALPMLVLFFYFMDPERGERLRAWVDQGDVTKPGRVADVETFYRSWNAHLTSQLQLLFAHLALFFGVKKQADAMRNAGSTPASGEAVEAVPK